MARPPLVLVVHGAAALADVPGLAALAADEDVEIRLAPDALALGERLPGAEVLLGWDFAAADLREAWDRADALRWIHWCGAGVDALLFPELARSGVEVTNARGVFDRAMAEYALALVLAFAKRLPETVRLQGERTWRHRLTERLDGRRALMVGAGGIGRAVARLLRAAGLEVEVVGRTARAGDPELGTVHGAGELRALLGRADYVILVAPLTPETRGLIGAGELAAMRPGARLVNLGRGALVDEPALVAALGSGHLGGAALDVFATEPLPASSPLWSHPRVIVSPHMSGDFEGHREALAAQFLENLARYRRGEPLRNRVDKALGYARG